MSAKKVLVTGAAGFLGRHLIDSLRKDGVFVRALIRPGGKRLPPEDEGYVEVVEADLCDPCSINGAFAGIDTVFHLAGLYRPGCSDALIAELRRVNVETTSNVVTASLSAGVRRFIHLSSAAACEDSGEELITEDTGKPITSYGVSKKESEEVLRGVPLGRMAWTIFRPTVVFGENAESPITRMAAAMQGGRFVVFGNGLNHVNFIYVGDVVSALRHAVDISATHGRTYILADEPLKFIELIEIIQRAAGLPGTPKKVPAWIGYVAGAGCDAVAGLTGLKMPLSIRAVRFMTRNVIFSSEKLKTDTGIQPVFGVRESVERTIQCLRGRLPLSPDSVPN